MKRRFPFAIVCRVIACFAISVGVVSCEGCDDRNDDERSDGDLTPGYHLEFSPPVGSFVLGAEVVEVEATAVSDDGIHGAPPMSSWTVETPSAEVEIRSKTYPSPSKCRVEIRRRGGFSPPPPDSLGTYAESTFLDFTPLQSDSAYTLSGPTSYQLKLSQAAPPTRLPADLLAFPGSINMEKRTGAARPTREIRFVFRNLPAIIPEVTSIRLAGTDSGKFELIDLLTLPVPANRLESITVAFPREGEGVAPGDYEAQIEVESNSFVTVVPVQGRLR